MGEDKFQHLHDNYLKTAYGKRNVLDGEFKGMMKIYEQMYGKLMPLDRKSKIVDIACGAGQFIRFCLNKGYDDVAGVDLSRAQVSYCETHVPGHVFLTDGLELLKNNPATYDLVVANDFIEHLTKDKGIEFVGLVYESLKKMGRIILKTGNMAAFGGLAVLYNTLDHECGYTERSLKSLLEMWGFEQIEIIPYYPPNKKLARIQKSAHWMMRQMYQYLFGGDYPKCYTKMIAVTGIKKNDDVE